MSQSTKSYKKKKKGNWISESEIEIVSIYLGRRRRLQCSTIKDNKLAERTSGDRIEIISDLELSKTVMVENTTRGGVDVRVRVLGLPQKKIGRAHV